MGGNPNPKGWPPPPPPGVDGQSQGVPVTIIWGNGKSTTFDAYTGEPAPGGEKSDSSSSSPQPE
jgi:hypothetical protein